MSPHPVSALVDAIYVINLPARTDRRDEMARQLARVGLALDRAPVRLFPAVRPDDAGPFPSVGARGCFLSHLGVLRDAAARGSDPILILEDDADFTRAFVSDGRDLAAALAGAQWNICYLGHAVKGPVPERTAGHVLNEVAPATAVGLTHAMLLDAAAIAAAVPYLEAQMARPGGDPAGGPMHVDGSYSWLRHDRPDLRTLATRDQWIVQRASRTDIHATGWKERVPLLPAWRRLRNRLAR